MKMKIDKSIVTGNFSRHALSYDKHAGIQKKAAALLEKVLPKGGISNILEIGCGTGSYTEILRSRFKGAKIRAIDISGPMVTVAKEKMGGDMVCFEVGDIEDMELIGEYDLITSNAVFHWLGPLEDTAKKLKRSLAFSGKIVFSSFGPKTFPELKWSLKRVVGRDISITPDGFPEKKEMEGVLRAYFKDVKVTERLIRESHPSIYELLRKIKYSGTRGLGIDVKRLWSRALLKKIEEEYAAEYGSIEATYQVFFCEAAK
jgi:malonyl-CoA O-methyltransferase